MSLMIIKKPIVGAYSNTIQNGSFIGSLDPWTNRGMESVSWAGVGGAAQADAISTPSTFTKRLCQHFPIATSGNYDYSMVKDVLDSPNVSLILKMRLYKTGQSGYLVLVNQTCGSLGEETHSGSFTSPGDYDRVEIEVSLESV